MENIYYFRDYFNPYEFWKIDFGTGKATSRLSAYSLEEFKDKIDDDHNFIEPDQIEEFNRIYSEHCLIAIARYEEGICLNKLEYVLEDDQVDIKTFNTKAEAIDFLNRKSKLNLTEDQWGENEGVFFKEILPF